jgi:hypothetical protein
MGDSMNARRPGLSPVLTGVLALVVLGQSAVLFLLLVVPPERDPILGHLRESRIVSQVIEMCLPAAGPVSAARTAFRGPPA